MALWQISDRSKNNTLVAPNLLKEQWDDGLKFKPGEAGFTTANVLAYAGAKPDGSWNFNYIGTPNWAPPPDPPIV